jgi:hypothetical protein
MPVFSLVNGSQFLQRLIEAQPLEAKKSKWLSSVNFYIDFVNTFGVFLEVVYRDIVDMKQFL